MKTLLTYSKDKFPVQVTAKCSKTRGRKDKSNRVSDDETGDLVSTTGEVTFDQRDQLSTEKNESAPMLSDAAFLVDNPRSATRYVELLVSNPG